MLGESIKVTWNDNIDENVQLDLYQNNALMQTIETSTPSDGEYLWNVPTDLDDSSSYRIKISSVNDGKPEGFSSYFRVYEPNVELSYPNNDFYTEAGNSLRLSWAENLPENVRLDLYKGDDFVEKIHESNPFSYENSYEWTVPRDLTQGADYRIKVSSTEDSEIYDFSDEYFTIYNETPEIKFIFPRPDTDFRIVPETDLEILWDDNISEDVRIDLYVGTDYRIKVTSLNYILDEKYVSDFSDSFFSIRDDICTKYPDLSSCQRR